MTLGNLFAKRNPANSIRSRYDRSVSLACEQCEPRHMLSGLSSIQPGPTLYTGKQQLMLNHLAEQFESSRIIQEVNELQLVDVSNSRAGTTAIYQRTIADIPVHGSFITVVLGNDGSIRSSVSDTWQYLETPEHLTPQLGLGQAIAIASHNFSAATKYQTSGELTWFRSGAAALLAWQIETTLVQDTPWEFTTVVDALDGTVLSEVQSSSVVESLVQGAETGVFPRIVINDAIGAQGSRDYGAPFDSVVALALGCTGTLIASDVVISARHCGAGAGSQILFGDNSSSPIYTATVQSSSLPDGGGSLLDGGDVAILTLTADVPVGVATPMRLIDATSELVDQVAATIGYGYNGLGSVGHGNTADGFRWGGENVIDVYGVPASASGTNIISTDFDNGSGAANTIPSGSSTPLPFEATTAPGDSGGPVLVQQGSEWLVAGVLSGGTTSTSVYGDISWWTGTAVFRTEIESAGGVFADGGLGNVSFDQTTYLFGDTLGITVTDSNGVNPVVATVVSDSGDSETLTLSDGGGGVFTGSIVSSSAGVTVGDGILQAADTDQLTVTYNDPDDGTGNPTVVMDTAVIFEVGAGALIGVDFDESAGSAPVNWSLINGGANGTFINLLDENGSPTAIDLAISELADGTWSDFAVTPAADTIPLHANALGNIDGQIYTGADSLQLTYSDLEPLADYEVYIMAAEGFYSSIEQQVSITGDTALTPFNQIFDQNRLFVNDQIGDNTRQLSEYAKIVTANSSGQIVIRIDPIAGTSDVVLAGAAISKVPDVDLIDPLAKKFLDGVIDGGVLADAETSDDVYFQLAPSPTSNPFKQKIDLLLLSLYTGGSLNSFQFTLEASLMGGPQGDVVQTIELWNSTDGIWELVDTRAATNVDSVVQFSATGDLSRFVHPLTNEVLSRVAWKSPSFSGSPFNWTIGVDQIGWAIS